MTASSIDPNGRLAALRQRMTATTARPEGAADTNLRTRFRAGATAEQDNEPTLQQKLAQSEIFKILNDDTIEAEEKAQQIAARLTFDFGSPDTEGQRKAAEELRTIVKQLLADFTTHNREGIQLARDNPLSALKTSIQSVFENYHAVVSGRQDLKGKLSVVDDWITNGGGEGKLVEVLIHAHDKKLEKERMEADLRARTTAVGELERDILHRQDVIASAEYNLSASKEGTWFFQGDRKRQNQEAAENLVRQRAELETKQALLVRSRTDLEAAGTAFQAFIGNEEFKIHEKILEVLDIGSDSFKEQLKGLAEATLVYIDDTEITLTGVRDQLEILLRNVSKTLTVNSNISEKAAVLQDALYKAREGNTQALKAFQARSAAPKVEGLEELSGVGAHEARKIEAAGNEFVSDLERTFSSITIVSGKVHEIESVLTTMKDQLQDGLADAEEQLVMAVTTASASGQIMLNRAQALGTMAQAVISRGQYQQEAREAFGDLVKDFERGVMAKMGRNQNIGAIGDVIKDISAAMEERNDMTGGLMKDKRKLLDDLGAQIDRLRAATEDAVSLDSRINAELYGAAPAQKSGAGSSPAPAA